MSILGSEVCKEGYYPFEFEYDPLMSSSADLGPILLNFYQTQIGVLRWMVELGSIDIIT